MSGYFNPRISEIVEAKTAAYTVKLDDHGKCFSTIGATGAVTFTLPPVSQCSGFYARFFNAVDQDMTVASAEGDNIVWDGDASVDSLAFSTTSHKIGGALTFIGSGTKWYVLNDAPAGCTVTAAT